MTKSTLATLRHTQFPYLRLHARQASQPHGALALGRALWPFLRRPKPAKAAATGNDRHLMQFAPK